MLALTIGPDPRCTEPDYVLGAVYRLHREGLLADCRPGTRPWGFWRFEPEVPDDLRAERPRLHRVPADLEAEPREREVESAAEAALECHRREWLESGHRQATTALGGAG